MGLRQDYLEAFDDSQRFIAKLFREYDQERAIQKLLGLQDAITVAMLRINPHRPYLFKDNTKAHVPQPDFKGAA